MLNKIKNHLTDNADLYFMYSAGAVYGIATTVLVYKTSTSVLTLTDDGLKALNNGEKIALVGKGLLSNNVLVQVTP